MSHIFPCSPQGGKLSQTLLEACLLIAVVFIVKVSKPPDSRKCFVVVISLYSGGHDSLLIYLNMECVIPNKQGLFV